MHMTYRTIGVLCVCVAISLVGVYFAFTSQSPEECAPISEQKKQEGSQGYRVWFGETLKSFEHTGKSVCVPDGWEAVGATEEGEGWARFSRDHTGVIVKSDAFGILTLTPEKSAYTITVLYPLSTKSDALNRYVQIISNAFSRVGALLPESKSAKHSHTVLITAGLGGDTRSEGTRVYPDPTENMSVMVRTPDQPRAEELFVHAVMHLFNRHRGDLLAYQKNQNPFPAEDWQEMEATWSETAFSTQNEGRTARIRYLYNVHVAVRTNNFSRIVSEPFNNKEAFEKIKQGSIVPEGSQYLDYQYGHYVLAPLTMVAIEGLLVSRSSDLHVEDILKAIHTRPSLNFFDELGKKLSKDDMARIMLWIEGKDTIPEELVMKGLSHYILSPQ